MTAYLRPEPSTASREHPDGAGPATELFSVGPSPDRPAPPVSRPLSWVVRTARGLTGFLGLLAPDGTLLEANQTASTPLERDLQDTLDHPFWDAAWWAWSPVVQQRLRNAVAEVAAGASLRYPETALVGRNLLVTVDLAWAPLIRSGTVTALICSAVDVTAGAPAHPSH